MHLWQNGQNRHSLVCCDLVVTGAKYPVPSTSPLMCTELGTTREHAAADLLDRGTERHVLKVGAAVERIVAERLGRGLKIALYNYMLGLGLDLPVRAWFR